MRRQRRTKIVATLGPASADPAVIDRMFVAGTDVFRINMSHTSAEQMRAYLKTVRAIEERYQRPIGVLVDLQGPKLRLGTFAGGGVDVKEGASFTLDSDSKPGDGKRVHLPHPEILAALNRGDRLLIDDGKVRLVVTETSSTRSATRVEIGGRLSDRKALSLPDTVLNVSALTLKDSVDLEAALAADVDWIALSFIQRPEDINEVKKLAGGRAAILAKIEKPQAVSRLADILQAADALMVARGDLGVEMPLEQVPGLQKQITRGARRMGRPVVVATQMLESMVTAPMPTRAEVSDVATAIFEGADAVMLSAESAVGHHPVAAVETMSRIAEAVERDPLHASVLEAQRQNPEPTVADAISAATRQIAETLDLAAILCLTSSGATAIRVARERPRPPIVALSPQVKTARRLALAWGVHCVVSEDVRDLEAMVARACHIAYREGFAQPNQRVIIVAGVPIGTPGATNMVRVAYVGPEKAAG